MRDAKRGTSTLDVSSMKGYKVGDWICLGSGSESQEYVQIVGFGSFKLGSPVVHTHPAGTVVVWAGHSAVGQPMPEGAAVVTTWLQVRTDSFLASHFF